MNREQTTLFQRIREYPFNDQARLGRENGWSAAHTARVVEEYRRFLFLAVAAGHPVSPSDPVDQAWHLHLTDTRDYWDRFCPQVLGRVLHHEPGRGGAGAHARLVQQYRQTLDSYRRFFGEEPPADLWPPPARRFHDGTEYRRVDTARVWMLPRPTRLFALAVAMAPLLTACDVGAGLFGVGFVLAIAAIVVHIREDGRGRGTRGDGNSASGCSGGGGHFGGESGGNCGDGGGSCGDGGGGGGGCGGGGCGGGCGGCG